MVPGIMFDDATDVDDALRNRQIGVEREENFRRLFARYYRPVHGFFARRGFSSEQSHDLTQETFVRVFQGMGGFRGDGPFEAWLFQVAANVYRNSLRSAAAGKRAAQLVSTDLAPESVSTAVPRSDRMGGGALDGLLEDERRRLLREGIASLPPQMRRCLVLRIYQDRTYSEIAVVLRISVETVKAHLFQARRQLRKRLAAYFEPLAELERRS